MSTDKKKVIYDGMHTEELNAALAANKAKNKALAGNSIVDQVDISTIANEKPEAIAPPKKKTSGTLSYEDSYTDAVKAKWANKGGKDAYIKAAKAYNTKKYGSTNPTADAKKAGMSKSELASKHKVDSTKFTESLTIGGKKTAVSDLDPKYTTVGVMAPSPTKTSNNASIAKTTAAANSSESLLGGVKSRREKRQGERSRKKWARQENRKTKDFSDGVYSTGSKTTKSTMPTLDTGAGTYQGAQKDKAEKKKNWKSSLSNKTFGM